jgi:hypothetical protein
MMAHFVSFRGDAATAADFSPRPLAASLTPLLALPLPHVTGLGAPAIYCSHIGSFCFHRPTPAAHLVCKHIFDPANPSVDLDVYP